MNRVVALYIRLSTEDYKVESMSIDNQKLALHKYTENLDDLTDYEITVTLVRTLSGQPFRNFSTLRGMAKLTVLSLKTLAGLAGTAWR